MPIAASATLIEKPTTLEYLSCLYTRAHGQSWVIPLKFTTATFAVKIASSGCANAGAHRAAVQGYNCMAAVRRISPILARQGPSQLHMRLYHDLVEFVRAWCVL